MVGALADWFAVTALFRHPLGLPIPHTAIVVERKEQFGQTLAIFFRENFLERRRGRRARPDLGRRSNGRPRGSPTAEHATTPIRYVLLTRCERARRERRAGDRHDRDRAATPSTAACPSPRVGKDPPRGDPRAPSSTTASTRPAQQAQSRRSSNTPTSSRRCIASDRPWWLPEVLPAPPRRALRRSDGQHPRHDPQRSGPSGPASAPDVTDRTRSSPRTRPGVHRHACTSCSAPSPTTPASTRCSPTWWPA